MKIVILHPFTPQAAGVVEARVATYHSQPHAKAMKILTERTDFVCKMEYFTPKRWKYSFSAGRLNYVFYPVDFTWNGDHKKWKKQHSKSCLKSYKKNMPDVTIINMSGHSGPFSHRLAQVILENKKQYIAMLGGQHYSDTPGNRTYYQNAHHILVHTQLQKETMEKMEMFRNLDIRVFPLGVDCEVFQPKEKENKYPQLLYVGRIVEWKRIHLAIEAVKMLKDNGFPDAQLTIIGPVSSKAYFTRLQKLVSEWDLKNNVSFLGHKEHADLPAYFQTADLFTLPSDKETFGMVMIEAMACSAPVAAMNCPGGPADVITHGDNGLLITPEDYSREVLNYFKNPQNIKRISQNARQTVLEKYSLEATYRVLENSVNDALS